MLCSQAFLIVVIILFHIVSIIKETIEIGPSRIVNGTRAISHHGLLVSAQAFQRRILWSNLLIPVAIYPSWRRIICPGRIFFYRIWYPWCHFSTSKESFFTWFGLVHKPHFYIYHRGGALKLLVLLSHNYPHGTNLMLKDPDDCKNWTGSWADIKSCEQDYEQILHQWQDSLEKCSEKKFNKKAEIFVKFNLIKS